MPAGTQLSSRGFQLEGRSRSRSSQLSDKILGFAHPPWCLIMRVLHKAQMERATLVVIAQLWKTQAWFPVIMEMLMDHPIILPDQGDVVTPSPNCGCPVQLAIPCTIDRVEGLRRPFQEKYTLGKASELILASWRQKTNSNYKSFWRKWEEWCRSRNVHPFSSGISEVLDFIADQFEAGRQYRSLNGYRSAISSCHLPVDWFAVGQHPLVSRLLKGVFNLHPAQQKYSHTWEVYKMLNHSKSLGPKLMLS